MRTVKAFVVAMSFAAAALGPARAATLTVDYVDGSEESGAHFAPDYFVARAGDVVHFDLQTEGFTPGVCESACTAEVVQFAGTGPYFRSNDATAFDATFQGGVVWFYTGNAATLSRDGACLAICGGYTDRPNPPGAPTIAEPAEGATLTRRDVTVSGTAEPWTVVSIRVDGDRTTLGMAGASGAWTVHLSSLNRSAHIAEITAIDAAGRRSPAQTLRFTIGGEAQPPTVVIDNADPYLTTDAPVYEGTATDDSGIASVEMTIGGDLNRIYLATCAPACPAKSVAWRIELPDRLTISGVRLKVEDVFGNVVLRNLTVIAAREP